MAHGEAHNSWISRAAFDPYTQLSGLSGPHNPSGSGTGAALADVPRMYRLGSVAQDAQLCLWDVPIPLDGELPVGMNNTRCGGGCIIAFNWLAAGRAWCVWAWHGNMLCMAVRLKLVLRTGQDRLAHGCKTLLARC